LKECPTHVIHPDRRLVLHAGHSWFHFGGLLEFSSSTVCPFYALSHLLITCILYHICGLRCSLLRFRFSAYCNLVGISRFDSTNCPLIRCGALPTYATNQSKQLAEEEEIAGLPGDEDDVMVDDAVEEQGYASSTPTSSLTWITWFCSLPGHEYFCEVTEDFIEDDFNLTGLNALVPFWKEAMEMVLDVEPEDALKIPDVSIVESSAELLYGLVHQRYILTRPGLQAMVEKYEAGHFGICPRVFCNSTHVAPCGRYDLPGLDTVKLYCPNCNDIYTPPSSRYQGVDGAFFGTTFAPLLFQTYRELSPASYYPPRSHGQSSTLPDSPRSSNDDQNGSNEDELFENVMPHGGKKRPHCQVYVPSLFGFRVSEKARSGTRMQWMRLRPRTVEELDLVDWRGQWKAIDDEVDPHDADDEDNDEGDGRPGRLENFDDDLEEDGVEEESESESEAAPPPPPPSRPIGGRKAVKRI